MSDLPYFTYDGPWNDRVFRFGFKAGMTVDEYVASLAPSPDYRERAVYHHPGQVIPIPSLASIVPGVTEMIDDKPYRWRRR